MDVLLSAEKTAVPQYRSILERSIRSIQYWQYFSKKANDRGIHGVTEATFASTPPPHST